MLDLIAIAALALAAASAFFIAVLVARRVFLARGERRREADVARLLPLALELVEGERTRPPKLSQQDQLTLASVLGSYSRVLRGVARQNIGAYFRNSPALRRELAVLDSRRSWRRATAAYVLGDMASESAVPALLDALGDGSREVRTAAARSLGRLRAAEAVEPVVRALAEKTIPRSVAGQALLDLGDVALPSLRRLLDADDAHVRANAAELLGLTGGAGDAEALLAALDDASAEVRAKAARALGRVGASAAARALRAALDDRVPFVRVAAARSLGDLRDGEAVPALLGLARDDDRFEVAQAAAQAALAIDPDAVTLAAADPAAGPHLHEAADLAAA
ncbi:MAG: HEAT repeat domain-containing protein [Gaiellaceae bacterium]